MSEQPFWAPTPQACREVTLAFGHQPSALLEAGRASEKARGPAELVGALQVGGTGLAPDRNTEAPEVLPPDAPVLADVLSRCLCFPFSTGVGNNNDGTLVLGATNIPWVLDSAIRRR